jgi:hypothetical protein
MSAARTAWAVLPHVAWTALSAMLLVCAAFSSIAVPPAVHMAPWGCQAPYGNQSMKSGTSVRLADGDHYACRDGQISIY